MSLVEPGAVATELVGHDRPEVQEVLEERFGGIERLVAEDTADTVTCVVACPRRTAVDEIPVRPTGQEG